MFLKKVSQPLEEPIEARAVTIEPMPGHSTQEIVSCLKSRGVTKIQEIASGFVSAQIDLVAQRAVERIAYVHPKRQKQVFASR